MRLPIMILHLLSRRACRDRDRILGIQEFFALSTPGNQPVRIFPTFWPLARVHPLARVEVIQGR